MMEPMKVIAALAGEDDHSVLVPFRLVVPSFLPRDGKAARMMTNDLVESYCEDAWVVDGSWKGSRLLLESIREIDWEQAPSLEYDWGELDEWGEKKWIPWDIWDMGADHGKRAAEIEPSICGDAWKSEKYAKGLEKDEWFGWTPEELMRSTCWMFHYAKNVCRGRLPEVLDNAMTMKSFEDGSDKWIKMYFSTKKYRKRNRKALAQIPWAA